MTPKKEKILVTVKTYPNPSMKYEETERVQELRGLTRNHATKTPIFLEISPNRYTKLGFVYLLS